MISFFAHSITLLSVAFSLGGVSNLYIRYRTRVLRLMLLFLLSLLFISAGFWINSRLFHDLGIFRGGIEALRWVFHLLGGGLNIVVLPYLVSDLVSIPLARSVKILLWGWNSLFIVLGIASFLFPSIPAIAYCLTVQQIATIFGSLVLMGIGMRKLRNPWWKSAFISFFVGSFVFLLLLVLDVLISTLPIPVLEPVDSLSLPVYLVVLTAGVFYFSGKFLSREAFVKKGKLTDSCLEFYQLTPREGEVIEELISGRTNKQIADRFFISLKTVENHLYSIYQKTDVNSRLQLLHALQSWGSE